MTLEVDAKGSRQSNRQSLTSKMIHIMGSRVSRVSLVRVQDLTESLRGEFGKVHGAQEFPTERGSIFGKN